MGKSNKKIKKNSKNKLDKKAIKLSKKQIITIASIFAAVLLLVAAIITVRTVKKRRADRTVRIAFYGLSEKYVEVLKSKIPVEENIILETDIIASDKFDIGVVKTKYDMLFTWKGEVTDSLADASEKISARVFETMPKSLRDSEKKVIPILLDNCEFTYSSDVIKKTASSPDDLPETFEQFKKYLNTAKGYVFSPFFTNGSDDRILIDLTGAMVMAEYGLSAYKKYIELLKDADSLASVLDVSLSGSDRTLRNILDEFKLWASKEQGLTHPAWYIGTDSDLHYFAQSKQIGVFFTLLSRHREIPYDIIHNYKSNKVPANASASNYGLIAPSICCMLLTDNANSKRYVEAFFTEDAQTELSNLTNLAPVHYRAQAYDRQADDVRYWAASCAGGAMPDIYLAVYQRKSKELEKICAEIREYIK